MKQVTDVLRGPDYLKEGWQVIRQPGLRRFVIIPLIANLLLFAALIGWGIQQFNLLMARLMPQLPDWAAFVEWLLWPMFALVVLLLLFFGFSVLANIIASPFYGFLAEKIAEQERNEVSPQTGWKDVITITDSKCCGEWTDFAKESGVVATPTLVAFEDRKVVARQTESQSFTSDFSK